jgi:hypothetical protein
MSTNKQHQQANSTENSNRFNAVVGIHKAVLEKVLKSSGHARPNVAPLPARTLRSKVLKG